MLRRVHELEQENEALREVVAYPSQMNLSLGGPLDDVPADPRAYRRRGADGGRLAGR
jgi:hypothetical protein